MKRLVIIALIVAVPLGGAYALTRPLEETLHNICFTHSAGTGYQKGHEDCAKSEPAYTKMKAARKTQGISDPWQTK